MAPILAYWKIRGFAQPIRLMLAYTGTKFEDKLYECGDGPDYDKSCWFDVKFTLGLDFPNLPYYIDGDVKLTQTSAIMRHIARKNDLCGSTPEQMDRVDMFENQVVDFRMKFVQLCYNPDFENLKGSYIENCPKALKQISEFLGDREWFAGTQITFPDFMMYEILDQHLKLIPDFLQDFPNLKKFVTNFEELENIKKYMNSSKFLKYPFNNKIAKFGN